MPGATDSFERFGQESRRGHPASAFQPCPLLAPAQAGVPEEAPGGFLEGLQIYIAADGVPVLTNPLLRPMRLARGELCALELGGTTLRREDDAGDAVTATPPEPPGRPSSTGPPSR